MVYPQAQLSHIQSEGPVLDVPDGEFLVLSQTGMFLCVLSSRGGCVLTDQQPPGSSSRLDDRRDPQRVYSERGVSLGKMACGRSWRWWWKS